MCEIIKQKKRETSFEISRFFLPLQCLTSVLSLRTSGIVIQSFLFLLPGEGKAYLLYFLTILSVVVLGNSVSRVFTFVTCL